MADELRVMLEIGPRGKRVVAVAPDWPGLERGAKTEEAAIARLVAYRPRYATVAALAGMADRFTAATAVDVVERYPGVGSTDFWGISFAFSGSDRRAMSRDEMERELALMQACWALDATAIAFLVSKGADTAAQYAKSGKVTSAASILDDAERDADPRAGAARRALTGAISATAQPRQQNEPSARKRAKKVAAPVRTATKKNDSRASQR